MKDPVLFQADRDVERPVDPRSAVRMRLQIQQAERLAGLLSALYDRTHPGDPALLWLTGRPEEVAAFVGDVRDAWRRGALPLERACEAIAGYLGSLQPSLESLCGAQYALPRCEPLGVTHENNALSAPVRVRQMRSPRPRPAQDTVPDPDEDTALRLVRA